VDTSVLLSCLLLPCHLLLSSLFFTSHFGVVESVSEVI